MKRTSKIWKLKYAPKNITDQKVNITGEGMRRKLTEMDITDGMPPHMIFSGIQGCGKTTFASLWSQHHMKYNAEAIKIITAETRLNKQEKKKIKRIKRQKSGMSGKILHGLPKFLYARAISFLASRPIMSRYKILIIREFHKIRNQESFRRVMELYPYCRFILVTQSSGAILEPIKSRCITVKFGRIKFSDFMTEIKRVADGEGFEISLKEGKMLYSAYNGNIGASISVLQLTMLEHDKITKDTIKETMDSYKKPTVSPLIASAFKRSLASTKEKLDNLMYKLEPEEIYELVNDKFVYGDIAGMDDEELGMILRNMANNEERLIRCAHKRVQLLDIMMNL